MATWENFAIFSKPSPASGAFINSNLGNRLGSEETKVTDCWDKVRRLWEYKKRESIDLSYQPCKQALTLIF